MTRASLSRPSRPHLRSRHRQMGIPRPVAARRADPSSRAITAGRRTLAPSLARLVGDGHIPRFRRSSPPPRRPGHAGARCQFSFGLATVHAVTSHWPVAVKRRHAVLVSPQWPISGRTQPRARNRCGPARRPAGWLAQSLRNGQIGRDLTPRVAAGAGFGYALSLRSI